MKMIKVFFKPQGFLIPATRKNIFCHPGGPKVSLGAFMLFLGQKGSFWDKFKTCFSPIGLQTIVDVQKRIFANKISNKGGQKQKLSFLTKKVSF